MCNLLSTNKDCVYEQTTPLCAVPCRRGLVRAELWVSVESRLAVV
jgi:hypothetical protein